MQSHLPTWLSAAIDAEIHGVSGKALAAEYARLSDAYRQGKPSKAGADSNLFWLAYLVGRMPATFAAIQSALRQIPVALLAGCESLLDLGSGPGTAVWAATGYLPGLKSAHAIEHSAQAVALAERLALAAPLKPRFEKGELPGAISNLPESDLVVLAYAAGEAGPGVFKAAMAKTRKVLLLVEPGTPAGFKVILQARRELDGLVAPCPQKGVCPLEKADLRWCHFSVRLERNRMARLVKGGELGYEDEKFSYAAFSKADAALAESRIIGFPRKSEGRVSLELCGLQGVQVMNLGKHSKAPYKKAKKAEWGDAWP